MNHCGCSYRFTNANLLMQAELFRHGDTANHVAVSCDSWAAAQQLRGLTAWRTRAARRSCSLSPLRPQITPTPDPCINVASFGILPQQ